MNNNLPYQRFAGYLGFLMIFTVMNVPLLRADMVRMPEPDPPYRSMVPSVLPKPGVMKNKAAPATEWLNHKTSNNLHPDHREQQMMWLMNRARSNPTQEGLWLAFVDDDDVQNALDYFEVNLGILMAEFEAIAAKPPAAFDVRLYNAAKAHSDDLIDRDAQDHDGQFDKVTAAGFSYTAIRGNVFSYSLNALYGHAGFNIDWGGNDGTGMQTNRGHRLAIMAMDGNYSNVGIAMVSETDPVTDVGPFVITGNYAAANVNSSNHYNRFLVGTVWEDLNDNDMYDPGEGIENITVRPDQGNYYAVTSNSGGYAVPVNAGDYIVTFSGTGIGADITKAVSVGSTSVLLDLLYTGNGSDDGDQNNDPGDIADDGDQNNDSVDDESSEGGGGGGCFIESTRM